MGSLNHRGDTFARDQQVYEENETVAEGLGPVYNATSCVNCHQNPNSGAASQITELRVGHNDANGNFVNPTILINDGKNTITGRSIVDDRAIGPQAQETIPATENIRTLRAVLNTLGDGFVEAIDDNTLIAISAAQPGLSGGEFMGKLWRLRFLRLLDRPASAALVGRTSTAACSPLLPTPISMRWGSLTGCAPRRLLKFLTPRRASTISQMNSAWRTSTTLLSLCGERWSPPRDTTLAATPAALAGQRLFGQVGCNVCHMEAITTAPVGTVIDGGMFTVPEALGDKIIHPFSDFLLHDIGTGDGIVQVGPQDTANKLRTAPLWGLRMKARFMHDLGSLSLYNAIERHDGEAHDAAQGFRDLSPAQKEELITFLRTL